LVPPLPGVDDRRPRPRHTSEAGWQKIRSVCTALELPRRAWYNASTLFYCVFLTRGKNTLRFDTIGSVRTSHTRTVSMRPIRLWVHSRQHGSFTHMSTRSHQSAQIMCSHASFSRRSLPRLLITYCYNIKSGRLSSVIDSQL